MRFFGKCTHFCTHLKILGVVFITNIWYNIREGISPERKRNMSKRTREQKYPDTATFHYHNANPKNRLTEDCVARAITTATGISYNDVVRGLAEIQCQTGYSGLGSKGMDKYMQSIGWVKMKQPRKEDGAKYTGAEFCNELFYMNYDAVVANIGGNHVVAIKEVEGPEGSVKHKVHDIWNSTGKCIGNYWVRSE